MPLLRENDIYISISIYMENEFIYSFGQNSGKILNPFPPCPLAGLQPIEKMGQNLGHAE
jgi:hypothetical protein